MPKLLLKQSKEDSCSQISIKGTNFIIGVQTGQVCTPIFMSLLGQIVSHLSLLIEIYLDIISDDILIRPDDS